MKQPTFDEFEDTVLSLSELTNEQLDLVILIQLLQSITVNNQCKKRKDPPSPYMYRGLRVCRTTFGFVHSVSEKRLTALKIHLNIIKNLSHNQDFEITKLNTFKTMLHQFSEFQSIVA